MQFLRCCIQNMELFYRYISVANHQPTTVSVWAQNSSLQTRLHMTFTSENYRGVNLLTYCCLLNSFSINMAPCGLRGCKNRRIFCGFCSYLVTKRTSTNLLWQLSSLVNLWDSMHPPLERWTCCRVRMKVALLMIICNSCRCVLLGDSGTPNTSFRDTKHVSTNRK